MLLPGKVATATGYRCAMNPSRPTDIQKATNKAELLATIVLGGTVVRIVSPLLAQGCLRRRIASRRVLLSTPLVRGQRGTVRRTEIIRNGHRLRTDTEVLLSAAITELVKVVVVGLNGAIAARMRTKPLARLLQYPTKRAKTVYLSKKRIRTPRRT